MLAGRRALALLLASLAGPLAIAAPGAAAPPRCNGERRLCDRPFDAVVIPATHNSMSARALGWQIPNQLVSIPDQLRRGVRGLLIDTYYGHRGPDGVVVNDATRTPRSSLYLCHVDCRLGASPLVVVLRAIRSFLRAHPANVMVIVNEDHVAPRDFAAAIGRSGLVRDVYRGRPGPRWPTLRTMIRRSQQVVMLAENDAGRVPWYHEAYAGIVQETPYSWPRSESIIAPRNWPSSCRRNRGGRRGSLFLMNHWSPTLAPSPLLSSFVNATSVLVGRARTCRRVRGAMPTIVAVDLFGVGGLLEAVHRLNATG